MRKPLILSSLLIAVTLGCSGSDTNGTTDMTATGGTAGTAGTGGTTVGAAGTTVGAAGTTFGTGGTGGTTVAAGGGGTGGTSFVVTPTGGTGGTTVAAGGGGAGGMAAGGGGAGGMAAGGGGAGGMGTTAGACSNTSWTITATNECLDTNPSCPNITADQKALTNAIDGSMTTRYTSGQPQDGMEEVVVTFPGMVTLSGINVVASAGDGPNMYAIEYSTDGAAFMPFAPPAAGAGSDSLMVTFPATAMKAIKVKQTGTTPVAWWSILEITMTGCMVN